MKKVGVLTYHKGLNHGGYLQAYCLQKAVGIYTEQVDILNYVNPVQEQLEWHYFVKKWPKTKRWGIYMTYKNLVKYYKFRKAFKKFNLTEKLDEAKLLTISSKYDIIITGSDEIWNIKNPAFPKNYSFFGRNLNSKALIAYAASIGGCTYSDINKPDIIADLNRYNKIGVRDFNTADSIEKLGCSTTMVLDPTFLHDPYRDFIIKEPIKEPYILIYVNSITQEETDLIKAFAYEKEIKIVGISYSVHWADYNMIDIGIDEWLSYFKYAEYIITNTFHGLIFSIKNKKPTWIVDNNAKKNKIDGLLKQLDINISFNIIDSTKKLEDHFNSFQSAAINSIKNQNILIDQSKEFLKNGIKTEG